MWYLMMYSKNDFHQSLIVTVTHIFSVCIQNVTYVDT